MVCGTAHTHTHVPPPVLAYQAVTLQLLLYRGWGAVQRVGPRMVAGAWPHTFTAMGQPYDLGHPRRL